MVYAGFKISYYRLYTSARYCYFYLDMNRPEGSADIYSKAERFASVAAEEERCG
jgi:hypothetical protein